MRRDVDNRELIKRIIEADCKWLESDEKPVYVIQCLQRKKDGCEFDNRPIYQHTLDRLDKIDKYFDIAVAKAIEYNARVYINVSPKDMQKVSLRAAQEFININLNGEINKSLESLLYSSLLKSGCSLIKKHIFDLDVETEVELNTIKEWANNALNGNYEIIPTISGYHMLVEADDYCKDYYLDTMSPAMKMLVIKIYMTNNHLTEIPNKHFKTMWNNLIHKESGNTLVYYKHP